MPKVLQDGHEPIRNRAMERAFMFRFWLELNRVELNKGHDA